MDLSTLNAADACEATFDLELKHPVTNEPLGLFISHKGLNSRAVLDVSRKQGNEILRKSFQAQRKAKDEEPPTIEEGGKRAAKLLAAASTAWFEMKDGKKIDGFDFGGDRLTFTTDAAIKLYDDPGFGWLRMQLDESVGDLGNFIKA